MWQLRGILRQMLAHELLRQAATILGAGWSKGTNARDSTGRIVPLSASEVGDAGQGRHRAGWPPR